MHDDIRTISQTSNRIGDSLISYMGHSSNHHKTLVLLEGCDDERFFTRFFDEHKTYVTYVGGCEMLQNVHRYINSHTRSFSNIAIKDRDFDFLNNQVVTEPCFFYTDCHDIEMMCFYKHGIIQEIFRQFALPCYSDIEEVLFSEVIDFSYFRWINSTLANQYNVRDVSCCNWSDSQIHDLDFFVKACIHHSKPNPTPVNKEDFDSFKKEKSSCDRFEIVNGHNFIQRLLHFINEANKAKIKEKKEKNINISSKDIGFDALTAVLFERYTFEDFKHTKLYEQIHSWAENGLMDSIFSS